MPGLGPITVKRILDTRTNGRKLRSTRDLGKPGKRLAKATAYLKFGY